MATDSSLIRYKLKRFFGYDTFKGDQEAIIQNLLEGNDTFVLMPTGGGKSLCFQLPALVLEDKTAIVISPLIALMKNQVDVIRGFDDKEEGLAHFLNSSLSKAEIMQVRQDVLSGRTRLLYVAPESLTKEENVELLKEISISFYAVDEAHCISEWGHDFRPEYRRIRDMVQQIGRAPIIALTATATPKVQSDIQKNLGIMDATVFKSSFNRPNLFYEVRDKVEPEKDIIRYIKQHPGKSGIIYCLSRKKVEEMANLLTINGIKALPYHAGLDARTRAENQDAFLMEDADVIVATIAFGMGIDKPDVRFVVHADMPDSPEAYFQEAGRAGRDGKPSYAVLLWNGTDTARLKQLEKVSFPSLEYIEDIYHKMHVFFEIPYDAGAGRMLKLDIKEFCKLYRLQEAPAYYAIKYLEREGHWTLAEDMDIQTRVRIEVDRTALYGVELPDPLMVTVLETLMRNYTGLFSFATPIDEEFVASKSGVTVTMLRQLLYGLSVNHIIRYIPQDHADVLFIAHDRLRPGNVKLSPDRYALLRSTYRERVETIMDYASEDDTCRSRYLLKYFGQEESAPCGSCDVCRAAAVKPRELSSALRKWIGEKGGEYTLDELKAAFGTSDNSYLEVLRDLIDRREVPPYK